MDTLMEEEETETVCQSIFRRFLAVKEGKNEMMSKEENAAEEKFGMHLNFFFKYEINYSY